MTSILGGNGPPPPPWPLRSLLLVVGHRVSGASGVCHQGDLIGPVGLLDTVRLWRRPSPVGVTGASRCCTAPVAVMLST